MVSALVLSGPPDDLTRAYARCEEIARAHYENFPVASRLLPAHMRRHIAAIYAFARRADDFADEPGRHAAERLRRLDDWEARLTGDAAESDQDTDARPIFLALTHTIRERRLPLSLFADLLSAFRQDVTTKRYRTWGEVLDYCRRSANPVGRLVLRVGGYADPMLDRQSDAICTALQLTNFWQDFKEDWTAGRLYIPLEDRDAAGASDADLDAGRMTSEWRAALAVVSDRTRALFHDGRPLCDQVRGRLRWELRVTWLGGTRILDKLQRGGFDPFDQRPVLGVADVPGILWHAVAWRQTAGG